MPLTALKPSQIRKIAANSLVGNATGAEARGTSLSVSQVRTLLGLGTTDSPTFNTVTATTSVLTPLLNNTNAAALIVGNSTYGVTVPGAATFSGNVGIGTASPGAALQVNSDTPFRLVTAAGNVIFDVVTAGAGGATFNFYRPSSPYPTGNLGGSIVTGTYTLTMSSPAGCSIGVGSTQGYTSDYPAQGAISVVGQLHGSYFSDLVLVGGCTYGDGQTAGHLRLVGGGAAASEAGVTPGNVYVYGGRGATDGNTIFAHTGSATRGRVLVGTATDDGTTLLQVAGTSSFSDNATFAYTKKITFASGGSIGNAGGVGGRVEIDSTTLSVASGSGNGFLLMGGSGSSLNTIYGSGASTSTLRVNAGDQSNPGTGNKLELCGGAGGSGNSNGGAVYVYGGEKTGSGTQGNVIVGHNGSATRGRVLVGTATDDGATLLQVAGGITASGTLNVGRIQNGSGASDPVITLTSSSMRFGYVGNGESRAYLSGGALLLGSNYLVAFSNTSADALGGSLDAGYARNAAGVLEINNGTLISGGGSYGSLKCASVTANGGATITGGGASGTAGAKIGSHSTGIGGLWSSTVTPSTTNYVLAFDGASTFINAPNAAGLIYFNAGGGSIGSLSTTTLSLPSVALSCAGITASGGAAITGGGVTSTGGLAVGSYGASIGGIWNSTLTPSTSNYALAATATTSHLNATTSVSLAIGGTDVLYSTATGMSVTPPLTITGFNPGFVTKVADYTLTSSDHTVCVTANSVVITLETAVGCAGREHEVINTGAGTVTLNTTSAQTISGNASGALTLAQWKSIRVKSDGSNWLIMSQVT